MPGMPPPWKPPMIGEAGKNHSQSGSSSARTSTPSFKKKISKAALPRTQPRNSTTTVSLRRTATKWSAWM
uniref:RBPJ-interacting and tubulin-associated protein n=1 Tax=Panagrellus redivivus TaxID=6233 RepID=A0A7E4ZX13_PANRE